MVYLCKPRVRGKCIPYICCSQNGPWRVVSRIVFQFARGVMIVKHFRAHVYAIWLVEIIIRMVLTPVV